MSLEKVMRWHDSPHWQVFVMVVWAMWQAGCAEPGKESPRIVTAEVGSNADVDAVDPPPVKKTDPGNGGSVLPELVRNSWAGTYSLGDDGLTKLDFFAATAPPRRNRDDTLLDDEQDAELEAKWRYLYAKEMLRERAKQ